MALILPTRVDSMAKIAIRGAHSTATNSNPSKNTRINAAKPAALAPTDMNAVTTEGAPS